MLSARWEIEDVLYWRLDVAFCEDPSHMRLGYAAENLAIISHIALNLLKADKTLKLGVKSKRLVTGWDNVYLLRLVASNLKL